MTTILSRLVLATLAVVASASPTARADTLQLNGAGATFPYPIYSKWFSDYQKVDPSLQINYQSIGSGAGIRQLQEKTIDFGASDSPMTDEQLAKSGGKVIHIPTVLGAVVLCYNLPGVEKGLKLSAENIADIFLGKVTKWNDPSIAKANPSAKLPDMAIVVARRSDGSGTTGIFTEYLSKTNPAWKEKVGTGTAVNWPTGMGGKGNEGVAGLIKQAPGTIGYVELLYADKNGLSYAAIKNKAGEFVLPSTKSVTAAAAASVKTIPADFRVSITDATGKGAYPISGFTYLLVPTDMPKEKAVKFVAFLKWALKDGQKAAEPLLYAPLPKELVGRVSKKVSEIPTK
jgi:phosphate transport system substrate-binding protein